MNFEKTIKYTPSTSIEELRDFCKLKYNIDSEIWAPVTIGGWEDFYISSYGRLYNIKTNNLRMCSSTKTKNYDINSIIYSSNIKINGKNKSLAKTVCDIILHAFFPKHGYIVDPTVTTNPIPRDENIYNLDLGRNLMFVPNNYYRGDFNYKEVPICINGEETHYSVDINGVIKNNHKNRPMSSKSNKALDLISIYHKDIRYVKTRIRYLAEAYIINYNDLKYVALIDETNTKLSLDNICWTNRPKIYLKRMDELERKTKHGF